MDEISYSMKILVVSIYFSLWILPFLIFFISNHIENSKNQKRWDEESRRLDERMNKYLYGGK